MYYYSVHHFKCMYRGAVSVFSGSMIFLTTFNNMKCMCLPMDNNQRLSFWSLQLKSNNFLQINFFVPWSIKERRAIRGSVSGHYVSSRLFPLFANMDNCIIFCQMESHKDLRPETQFTSHFCLIFCLLFCDLWTSSQQTWALCEKAKAQS